MCVCFFLAAFFFHLTFAVIEGCGAVAFQGVVEVTEGVIDDFGSEIRHVGRPVGEDVEDGVLVGVI